MVSAAVLLQALRRVRLLAIARGGDAECVERALAALADEGVVVAEVSLSDGGGLQALENAAASLADRVMLGAGTVLDAVQVEAAARAGARFVVTPGAVEEVHEACERVGLPVLAGALTPTEVLAGVRAGAAAVKLFPAFAGGPDYLRALREPFPSIPFVPVGGIGPDEARAHLAAGALAVGVGSRLFGDALSGGDLAALRDRARALRAAVEAR